MITNLVPRVFLPFKMAARRRPWHTAGLVSPNILEILTISIPESSGFFVSGWSPGETLGQWDESEPGFLGQNNRSLHETANQKERYFIRFALSGIEIEILIVSNMHWTL